jgi:hypothetical protein
MKLSLSASSQPVTGPEFWFGHQGIRHAWLAMFASSCGHANYIRVVSVVEEGFEMRLSHTAVYYRFALRRFCGAVGTIVNGDTRLPCQIRGSSA